MKLKGSAVEVRIYAEDPQRNFLPSTGRLVRYRPPKLGTEGGVTTRLNSGVEEGGEISAALLHAEVEGVRDASLGASLGGR